MNISYECEIAQAASDYLLVSFFEPLLDFVS